MFKTNLTIQFEVINQKILAKKEDLKGTETGSSNTNKRGLSKITKENSSNKWEENARRHTNNRLQRKQNNFGVIYVIGKNTTKRPNGCKRKQSLGLEEGPDAIIHLESLRKTLKKIPNWKTPGNDGTHGFLF